MEESEIGYLRGIEERGRDLAIELTKGGKKDESET